MPTKKDDLEKDELEKEDVKDELEDSDDSTETLSDEKQEDDSEETKEDDDKDDDDLEVIPAKVYKGLQRTVAKKDAELEKLKVDHAKLLEEQNDLKSTLDSGEKVRFDLQQKFKETSNRIAALELENEQSKVSAMQNRVIAAEFPGLARLKDFVPSAATEDEYRENCKSLTLALGTEVNKSLEKELTNSTPPVEDTEKQVSQATIDKLYAKAMKMAGIRGKEDEYEKTMDEYMKALQSQ